MTVHLDNYVLIVRRKYHHFSDKVEMEYRLLLTIDMSLYRHKKIIFGGCAKFHPLAFLKSNMAANRSPKSLKEP